MLRKPPPDLGGDVIRMVRVACIIFAALIFTFGFAPHLVALDHKPGIERGVRGALDHLLDLRMGERLAIRRARDHLLSHLRQRARRSELVRISQ